MNQILDLFEKAKTLQLRGKWREAERIYQEIIKMNKYLPGIFSGLGEINLRFNKPSQAEKNFLKEIQKGNQNSRIYQYLSISLILQGKWEEALQNLERALSLDPKDYRPYIWMGYIYLQKGEIDKAILWLELAGEELDTLSLHLYLLEAYRKKGLTYKVREEIPKIEERISSLRNLFSCQRLVKFVEAKLQFLKGEMGKAVESLKSLKRELTLSPRIYEGGVIFSKEEIEDILSSLPWR